MRNDFFNNSAPNSEVIAGTGPLTVINTGNSYSVNLDRSSFSAGTYGDSSNYIQVVIDEFGKVTNAVEYPLAVGTTPIWYSIAGDNIILGTDGSVVTISGIDAGSTSLDLTSAMAWGGTKLDRSVAVAWGGTKQDNIGFKSLGNNTLSTSGNVITVNSNTYMTAGTARIGDDVNYTSIDTLGRRMSVGSSCLWESLVLPMYGSPAGTKEAVYSTYGTNGVMKIRQLDNATGTSIDEVFGMMQLPHRWKENSSIYPYIHWCPMDNTAGTVVFQVNYATVRFEDGFTAEEGTLEFHGTCGINERWIQKTTLPSIIGGGGSLIDGEVPMEGSLIATSIMLRIFRDGNHIIDDYAGAVGIKAFNILYETDGDGARTKWVK